MSESTASYDDKRVNNLRKKLWAAAFKFAEEARDKGRTLSGLELLMALHQMIEETHHHWIEDKKKWHDILGASPPRHYPTIKIVCLKLQPNSISVLTVEPIGKRYDSSIKPRSYPGKKLESIIPKWID